MSKHLIYTIFCCLLVMLSCDNELDLLEEGDPIPIVYALLDVTDTAQYVRVEKAFADPDIPASELALDPNNLYFEEADVVINIEGKGDFVMQRVDLNLEGYPREEGSFAQSPNYAYKAMTSEMGLTKGDVCNIRITLADGKVATATTKVIEPAFLVKPRKDGILDFDESAFIRYNWNPGDDGLIHSMSITIHYNESINGGDYVEKSILWPVFRSNDKTRYEFSGLDFYNFIAGELEADPAASRILTKADVLFVSGGQSLADFARVSKANLGITSSGDIPIFTNIEGGRGLIGSRATIEIPGLPFSVRTLESLRSLDATSSLNFE